MKRVILFVMRGYRLCSSDDDDDNMRVPSQPWLEDMDVRRWPCVVYCKQVHR